MEHDQKPYKFLKEIIKEKELTKKEIGIRIGMLIGGAILFGVIAAFVFAAVEPHADAAINGSAEAPKVDIPKDEDPDSTASSSVSGDGTDEAAAEAPENTPAETPALGLSEYQQLYQDMLAVAEVPQQALVTVIGITSQMDYFNQNYERQQQISGLLVANNGQDLFVLTEYRVVENVERIQLTFCDGTMVDAIFQKNDPNTGLAILRVALSDVPQETKDTIQVAPLGNSYGVVQGEPILALGSPIGYSNSVAYGVVTSVTNTISTIDTEYNLLTTDIIGSKEGSGILVNLEGEVIGFIAQNYSTGENIVTGLAISQLKQLIENLSNNTPLPYLGIKGQDVTTEISDKTGIPKGVLVNSVEEDSPAMMSGIKEYDVIVKIGEDKVSTLIQYHDKLSKCVPGKTVKVTAMRKGAEGYVEVNFDVMIGELK
ncbi:MAG: S1C family serine protease [Lachnospiraceae bacterium]|nr:S1C family serine protease [Lachnospiraceae bacterium]